MGPHPILIAGATASGKSAVALRLAAALDGVVINADSMQLYRELRILTARPTTADEALTPHRLYGIWPAAEPGSVGRWLALARTEVEAALEAGRTPIVVGGSGLYFNALTEGLVPVPEIPPALRERVRQRLARLGNVAFHAELAARDPAMARRLGASDPQRLQRAYEVVEATGRSLLDWQAETAAEGGLGMPWRGFVLGLPRVRLYRRIEARLDAMIEAGVLDEVRRLADLKLDPELPAMKALAIPELIRHLDGEIDLETALLAAKQATRRYAKRQLTWQRNKMHAWNQILTQESECFIDEIFSKMMHFLLTP